MAPSNTFMEETIDAYLLSHTAQPMLSPRGAMLPAGDGLSMISLAN